MKQAIAVILADTHLKEDNIEVNKSIYRQATQIAQDLGLSCIDHAGDIFNSRKAQSQLVLTTFKEILDELWNNGIQLNSCVGNHDKTDYSAVESFLDPFTEHPAINLFPIDGNRKIQDIFIHYLSYFSDDTYKYYYEEKCEDGFKKFSKYKNILITHIGISGAVMNNGTVIESDSINPCLFEPFDLTLVGHYHDAQVLAGGRIKYIGASIQHNFGELTGKGLTVLYDDLTTEIVPLKYPQYIKYEVAPKDITKKDIEELQKERQESGDNIRLVLTGTDAELKSFNKQILIEAGLSVQHKTDEIQKEELEQRVEAFDMKSLKEEFESFCEKNKLDLHTGMKYFEKIIAA
jgi:exonuclease SbcD